jgi:hypothetical protein
MPANVNAPDGLYGSLEPNQIRLLRLSPDGDTNDIGSLEAVDLDDAPPYYALSHSWTSQHSYTDVHVGGKTFTLGADLAKCVGRLSQLHELDTPVQYIWIDNICIDQSNLTERSAQVSLMGRLYRGAIRTIIWLGGDTTDCYGAWDLIENLYRVFREQNPTATEPSDIPIRMFHQSEHDAAGLPAWDDYRWTHLARLMERRWFSRIWVVQEVALSSQDPLFLHDEHYYPWSHFGWASAWLRKSGYMRLPQIPEQLRNVDTMTNLQRARTPWPLDALISITQVKFNATDQRDKIYGLMGLARETQDTWHLPNELRPDYEVDVTDLYPKVAHFMLEESQSLSFFTRARCVDGSITRRQREHQLDLPSWCPDWSDFKVPNEGIATSLSWVHTSDPSQPARLGYLEQFSASTGLKFELGYDKDDPRTLSVRGIRATEVTVSVPFAVNPSRKVEPEQPFTSSMIQILSEALKLLKEDNFARWAQQFVKVTTVEQYHFVGRNADQGLRDGIAYVHQLLAGDATLMSLWEERSGNKDALVQLHKLSNEDGVTDYYKSLLRNYGFDRAFLVTSDGRMGIGPSNTRPGDTIAVLGGGDVPYCVRKEGDHWLLVGESCVEGLMKGEAAAASQQGVLVEETLTFR